MKVCLALCLLIFLAFVGGCQSIVPGDETVTFSTEDGQVSFVVLNEAGYSNAMLDQLQEQYKTAYNLINDKLHYFDLYSQVYISLREGEGESESFPTEIHLYGYEPKELSPELDLAASLIHYDYYREGANLFNSGLVYLIGEFFIEPTPHEMIMLFKLTLQIHSFR
jgi:hypothetical protein